MPRQSTLTALENQWMSHNFHLAIDHAAKDMLGATAFSPEQHEAARQRVLLHWLMQVAPAGCA